MAANIAGENDRPAAKRQALQPSAPGDSRGRGGPRRVDVRDLLGSDRELILIHEAAESRLRLTSNDKLILTK